MIDGLKNTHGEIGDNGEKWMGKRDKLWQSDELNPDGCSSLPLKSDKRIGKQA